MCKLGVFSFGGVFLGSCAFGVVRREADLVWGMVEYSRGNVGAEEWEKVKFSLVRKEGQVGSGEEVNLGNMTTR